ncbi:MAG: HD domain-containing protein [Actinobacteria bacterium]|nr:MAG: HD domain-containing protein [Actinomycetota bacterium]
MLSRLFHRLHNQIVVPLVIGAIIVAFVATIIAVRIISPPIEARVRSNLSNSAVMASNRFGQQIAQLRNYAKVVAESENVEKAIVTDARTIRPVVIPMRATLGVDFLSVLDRNGKSLTSLGEKQPPPENYRASRLLEFGSMEMNAADVIHGRKDVSLAAIAPTRDERGTTGYIVVGRRIDRAFLLTMQDRSDVPLTLIDFEGKRVLASTLATRERALLPSGPRLANAQRAIERKNAIERSFSLGETVYIARYVPLLVEGQEIGVLEVVQPTTQVVVTTRQTTVLIVMWSGVAVLVLFGLGLFIAHKVSKPIRHLATTAGRVAEGDFTPVVEVHGKDEIAELSSSFNAMTSSLREQTAALTKRLVELYAFYDMSKALGRTLDLDELLDTVLDSALKVLRADCGYVMLADRETDELVLKARRGPAGPISKPEEVSESIGRWVLQEGKPLLFGEGKYRDSGLEAGETPKSAICVPLKVKDNVIGVITVSSQSAELQFTDENVRLLSSLAGNAAVAIENAQLFKSLEEAYMGTVKALAAAIDAKDSYTQGHSTQVAHYVLMLAEEMGLCEEDKKAVETAAYLHDIGKIGVRDEILLKPGRLSLNEMNEIRHHSMISANILAPVPFPWQVTPIVRHHHERWDGSGYPAGLKGHEIPLLARMLAVADAFDAMTSKRPYRKKKSIAEGIAELKACAGTHFDPELVPAFIKAVESAEAIPTSSEEPSGYSIPDQFDREEVRAIFVSLVNGIMGSYRRLGGPRVAANLEEELNEEFSQKGFPITFHRGFLTAHWNTELTLREEIEMFREALAIQCRAIESLVGSGIILRFFTEVLEGLSTRFQMLAARFGLDSTLAAKGAESRK